MRRTPLHEAHVAAGARMVDFHGWEMPVQYPEGILDEVRRVRRRVGLFDLCHMGRLVVRGPAREALVERVFSATLGRLGVGRAKYGFLLDADGYPIDDVLAYRDEDAVHLVINATGRQGDPAWVRRHLEEGGFAAALEDVSDQQAMLALQGPASEMTLQPLCGIDLSAVRFYGFAHGPVAGVDCLVARTGYTGEDGFELFFEKEQAPRIWDELLAVGRSLEIGPIGLGARDTLRLEAGMPLYGQEMGPSVDPLEADLAFGVDLDKTDTVGVEALRRRHAAGPARRAVSLAAAGSRIPRAGCPVLHAGERVGHVTSGGFSPTLEKAIARALVTSEAADAEDLAVVIRAKAWPFAVVPSPFYRRARRGAIAWPTARPT